MEKETKYIIHTCPQRLWYVEKYLIPSLQSQYIPRNSIFIQLDCNNIGTLENFIKSAKYAATEEGGVWHLQDDVLICKHFKQITEQYNEGIVCGIATKFDRERKECCGEVGLHQMWYSFPCIRIPNEVMNGFVEWFETYMRGNPVYRKLIESKKHDDMMFRMYLEDNYEEHELKITNLNPNIVEHIDWLIGGSVTNKIRDDKIIRSLYFKDEELVLQLEKELNFTVRK